MSLPRITLCNLPTPLQEAMRLSAVLGGPRIFFKRDDLIGLALGGNKLRMLEFHLAEAKKLGTDVLIYAAKLRGNQTVQTLAAACKLGMETILFSPDKGIPENQGNFLLCSILASEIREVAIQFEIECPESLKIEMGILADSLRSKGRRPYIYDHNLDVHTGIVGYFCLVKELKDQLKKLKVKPDYLFMATGGGNTQAGLVAGAKYYHVPYKIIGIAPTLRYARELKLKNITEMAQSTADYLGVNLNFYPQEINVSTQYAAENLVPTRESIEATRLVAQTEGIFLDPLYTGKAMAALIHQIREGFISAKDIVVFYHSGGIPSLFSHSQSFF